MLKVLVSAIVVGGVGIYGMRRSTRCPACWV